jgi:hypothetical protein
MRPLEAICVLLSAVFGFVRSAFEIPGRVTFAVIAA